MKTESLIRNFLKAPKSFARSFIRTPLIEAGLTYKPEGTNAAPRVRVEGARNSLREYFEEHDSGNGIWKFNHYFDFYNRYLAKFVGSPITLLEIGIFSGGSLPMWRKFFGPQVRIWGVDIEPACSNYAEDGIDVFIGSQADRQFLAGIKPGEFIDVCIDDGSHVPEHQIISFEALFPRLNPGGVYICEDIHGGHNRFLDYVQGLIKSMNTMSPTKDKLATPTNDLQRWVRAVHIYPFAVVVEKREDALEALPMQKKGTVWQPFSAKSKN